MARPPQESHCHAWPDSGARPVLSYGNVMNTISCIHVHDYDGASKGIGRSNPMGDKRKGKDGGQAKKPKTNPSKALRPHEARQREALTKAHE